MPAKGKTRLSDEKRAEIVLAKTVLRGPTDTDGKLASDFGVSEITIKKHNYDMLTENQREIYEKMAAELKDDALSLTQASLRKSLELVRLVDDPKLLSGVVAAGKFGHEAYRLESGQSTTNVSVQGTYELRCREYLEAIVKHDPGASVERKREYLLKSKALADVPVEVREKIDIV